MKRTLMVFVSGFVCLAGVAARTQQPAPDALSSADVIKQARQYFFQARQGQFEVAPKAVALVEAAVAKDPDNAELLHSLSFAYSLQMVAAMQPGGNMMAAMAAGPKAFAAISKAIQIAPTNPDIVSLHGGMLGMAAMQQNRPEWMKTSREEIYRAVELGPSLPSPRLLRATLGLTEAPDVRDTPVLIEDLSFLASFAEGSRAGDVEHLLLGDVYAEIGKGDEAKRQYQAAARRPASVLKTDVEVRLAALDRGELPKADIAKLRGRVGDCVMCHGK